MTNLIMLAAGRGSRLGSLTDQIPKALNVFRGKTLIEHVLDSANKSKINFNNRVIIGGYKSEKFENFDCTIIKNGEWETTGPFYSLNLARNYLQEEECIVTYTDIIYSPNFLTEIQSIREEIVLPSNINFLNSWQNRKIDINSDLETFVVNGGYLKEIGGKIEDIGKVEGQFSGIVKFTPAGWRRFTDVIYKIEYNKLDMTSVMSQFIQNQGGISVVNVEGFWQEFDNPDDFNIS